MRLSYIGHATFLVASEQGVRILVDPFQPGAFGRFRLRPHAGPVDVVASTHDHIDHFHVDPSFGDPAVIRGSGEAAGIDFQGIPLPHDDEQGEKRGWVTGLRFEVDGVAVFHPGDLGRPPTAGEVARIGRVDVLLLPVGGTFTVGPEAALETMRRLAPAVAIPMHYLWPSVDLALLPRDDFLALVPGWRRVEAQPLRVDRAALPEPTQVLVLDPLG